MLTLEVEKMYNIAIADISEDKAGHNIGDFT